MASVESIQIDAQCIEHKPGDCSNATMNQVACAFCRQDGQLGSSLGPILHFGASGSRKIAVHEECALWAPNVYEVCRLLDAFPYSRLRL